MPKRLYFVTAINNRLIPMQLITRKLKKFTIYLTIQ